jgi:hypothetical protein
MIKILPNDFFTRVLEIPNTWVIFDSRIENNEVWISLRPTETPLSDRLKTDVLRHLEVCGRKAYLKLYFSNEEELNTLPIYTNTGFCKPFVAGVERMLGSATDNSIRHLYDLTDKELEKIKNNAVRTS